MTEKELGVEEDEELEVEAVGSEEAYLQIYRFAYSMYTIHREKSTVTNKYALDKSTIKAAIFIYTDIACCYTSYIPVYISHVTTLQPGISKAITITISNI